MLDKIMTKIASDETLKERVGSEDLLKEAAALEQDLINHYKTAETSEVALVEEFLGKYSSGEITVKEINAYDAAVREAQEAKLASYEKLAELYDQLITDEQRAEIEKTSAIEDAFVAGFMMKQAQSEELPPDILDAILQWIQENPELVGSLLGGGLGAGVGGGLGGLGGAGLGGLAGAGLGGIAGSLF